jgi:hypothetical protein
MNARWSVTIVLMCALAIGCAAQDTAPSGGKLARFYATLEGLRWLKREQDITGAWRSDTGERDRELTGLALWAYCNYACTDRQPKELAETVGQAVNYLVASCDREGSFGESMVGQAICTIALVDFAAMAHGDRARAAGAAAQRAIDYIVKQQGENGLFSGGDVKITLWQIMTLWHARIEVQVPETAMARAKKALALIAGGGRPICPKVDASGRMTGEPSVALAALCCFLRSAFDRRVRLRDDAGFKWLVRDDRHLKIARDGKDIDTIDCLALALFVTGGDRWRVWYPVLARGLRSGQIRDGKLRGSWPANSRGERIRRTALATLIVRSPYRGPTDENGLPIPLQLSPD